MKAITNRIDSETLQFQTYTPQDLDAIPSEVADSFWGNDGSKGEYAECTIISFDQTFQITDQSFQGLTTAGYASATGIAYNVSVDPEKTLRDKGFTGGNYNIIYRFLRNELSSSSDARPYFIKEISGDRTELRVATNFIGNDDLLKLVTEFKTRPNLGYFQDFYLNFGSNNLVIANNVLVDNSKEKYDLLINLYEPLPSRFILREPLWIVTQPADPLAFNVQFQPEVITPKVYNPTIKSANFNVPIKDKTNNSTQPISYEQLITSSLVSSYQQINSYLADKGINISIDYSKFENFIHFSSAKSRVENFAYKVQLIEKYEDDIAVLEAAGSTPLVESNILYLNNKIDDVIKNLDGFEYYLYFESGSTTYPKSTNVPPYTLQSWGSAEVNTWYTSSIMSASFYDENNKDYLINTIPDYLREDPQNDPYKVFVDMMGQQYDNIWIYYKDVTNRYSGDNRLGYGISKDLVADAIRSFGLNVYQNSFSSVDLFNAFIGYNPDNKLREANPPIVNDYISVSQESLEIPLDDVNKEMYKRIYHNLPYLLKSKGTVAGLQNIISMFGIPNTVLSVKEFGGIYSQPSSTEPVGSLSGINDIVPDAFATVGPFGNVTVGAATPIEIVSQQKFDSTLVPIVTLDGNNTYKPLVLSTIKSIFQEPWYNNEFKNSLSPSVNTAEIAFSPQNDVNKRVSGIDWAVLASDPEYDLNGYAPYYLNPGRTLFPNNTYNLSNYLNVIKQFDNSLFLMIKDFVPAKTNLKSGIVIKSNKVNRSKHDAPRAYVDSSSYTGTSIPSETVEGGTGGSFDPYNTLTNPSNSQFWYEQIPTPLGYTSSYHSDQSEFYNGELPNSAFVAVTGEGNPQNLAKYPGNGAFEYIVQVTFGPSSSFLGSPPSQGGIELWYDNDELLWTSANDLLGPGATPTLGTTSTPVVKPSVVLPPLPDTTDRDGSSGGGSGGGLGVGGNGRVVPTRR